MFLRDSGRLLLIAVLLLVACCGCREEAAEEARPRRADVVDESVADKLRATPYVGSVDVDEDEVGGVVFCDAERSCPGYNLYAVQTLSMAELIDEAGNVLKTWRHTPSELWGRAELLPNGDLLAIGAEHSTGPMGKPIRGIADDARYVLRLDWDGRLLWKQMIRPHHDIEVTPDGRLALLTAEMKRVPDIHPTLDTRDDYITLLRQNGELIESKSLLDAVSCVPQVFPLVRVKPTNLGGTPSVKLFHANSVEWMHHKHLVGRHPIYDLDNVLVCFRNQNRIAVINWTRNAVVWAWGQGEIHGPHDAQCLDNGNILLFDNGLGRGYSRAIELDPVTKTIVWQYKATPPSAFYTASKGSVQRLPNGNTLLAESDAGRAIEITPAGEVVWEFICPHKVKRGKRAAIVRMKRLPHSFVEAVLRQHEQ